MDTTFITIHDLSNDAHILYSSDSIVDILGFTPDEVVNQSVWQFFHPDELPFARVKHSRGVRLDKAAVLSYCRLKNRRGDWIGCECCFSVVHDVMVCCTSVYRNGMQSQKRAVEAPIVRKLFSSSPLDPRYHMLSHLSSKFHLGPEQQTHEPRAALFLNRFTRTLTIMYATSGIEQIIGISGEAMKGRSFYYCIALNCLEDAVRCLESAKGNDSIAYLRFFFRDPRQDDPPEASSSESEDDIMTDVTDSDNDTEDGVDHGEDAASPNGRRPSTYANEVRDSAVASGSTPVNRPIGTFTPGVHHGLFDDQSHTSTSSVLSSPRSEIRDEPIELEAVISCTSDGLVVCLRRARPMLPGILPIPQTSKHYNGIYAAPWAVEPIFHPAPPQMLRYTAGPQHPIMTQSGSPQTYHTAFMQSIRDVAVFAWALAGINGSLTTYAHGSPTGASQPPDGYTSWKSLPDPAQYGKPSATPSGYVSGSNSISNSSSNNDPFGFGDPGLR